jgi:DNA-binding NarL/FixJ family response regulator
VAHARILLVGQPDERARLRAHLNGALRVVGEFPTLTAAEMSGIEADAILLASRVSQDVRTARYDIGDEDDTFSEPLTPREIQVLELLAEGLPNKTIAERLDISDQTVKFHVASIFGKLNAANRTDAVRRAVRRGLIAL